MVYFMHMKIKNPMLNAAVAAVYIVLVVVIMNNADGLEPFNSPILAPAVFLSLFTLSAAVMGYLFLGEPLMLYLDGKKKEAVAFFIQTLLTFAGITALLVLIVFLNAKMA